MENIEQLLVKMAHFHMHHFFFRHTVAVVVGKRNGVGSNLNECKPYIGSNMGIVMIFIKSL